MKISEAETLLGEMNGQESWGNSSNYRLGEGKLKASLVLYVRQFSSDASRPVSSTKGCILAKEPEN
jgi:hypothetical protein